MLIDCGVTNTTKSGKLRGQVIPYADPEPIRIASIPCSLPPAGLGSMTSIPAPTSSGVETSVAKVFLTCELTIFALGSHSATGEEWTDNDNAGTSAEAQAFKRACACFGLGRYLYYFDGVWVDLDERKRPKSALKLFGWATPKGWRQGLRPQLVAGTHSDGTASASVDSGRNQNQQPVKSDIAEVVRRIEAFELRRTEINRRPSKTDSLAFA